MYLKFLHGLLMASFKNTMMRMNGVKKKDVHRNERVENFLCIPPWVYIALIIAIPPVVCSITYALAVHFGHVHADFPTISVAVNDPPESCIFGSCLNVYAVCSLFGIYIRFKQVELFYKDNQKNYPRKTNNASFICGILSAIGVFLAANFQVEYVMVVHLIGSFSLLFFGTIYCWIQTVMSFYVSDTPGNNCKIRKIRLGFSLIQTILFLVFFTTWPLYEDPFWYRIAAISEWLLCFAISTYVITFLHQFRGLVWESKISSKEPRKNEEVSVIQVTKL